MKHLLIMLACVGIVMSATYAACTHVDSTVRSAGSAILGRLAPAGYQTFTMESGFPRRQKCAAEVSSAQATAWGLSDNRLQAEVRLDGRDYAIELSGERTRKREWEIVRSDVDSDGMRGDEFEGRIKACLDALATVPEAERAGLAQERKDDVERAQSWKSVAAPHQ